MSNPEIPKAYCKLHGFFRILSTGFAYVIFYSYNYFNIYQSEVINDRKIK